MQGVSACVHASISSSRVFSQKGRGARTWWWWQDGGGMPISRWLARKGHAASWGCGGKSEGERGKEGRGRSSVSLTSLFVRATATTVMPRLRRPRTTSRPMPLPPPVTRATCRMRSLIICSAAYRSCLYLRTARTHARTPVGEGRGGIVSMRRKKSTRLFTDALVPSAHTPSPMALSG